MKNTSDYRLHYRDDKISLYRSSPGLWRSEELSRWMCTNPTLINAILGHDNFAVHDYRVDGFIARFGLNLDLLQKINGYLPLAREGEEHKVLRKKFIRQISQNMQAALQRFDQELETGVNNLNKISGEIDLVEYLAKPALDEAMRALADISVLKGFDYWSIAQMFDETISVSKRVEINNTLAQMMEELPDSIDEEEKLFKLAMLALGSNSLLGSIMESFVSRSSESGGLFFREMDWSGDLPVGGVPIIEKRVVADTWLGTHFFSKNDRVRLYLESAGYQNADRPVHSLLHFAPGRHLCPGMAFSLEIWKIFVRHIKNISKRCSIVSVSYRKSDCVFNYPESIVLRLYD